MTAKGDSITPRELMRAVMRYEPVDRLPVLALEPFETTAIQRWRGEGLPEGVDPVDFLGMSRLVNVPVNFGPIPAFESKVIFEDDEYRIVITNMGATIKQRKENPSLFYGGW